jgi:hypothetical protein
MELEQTINTLEECASRVWEKVALVSTTAHSTAFPKKKNRLAIYLALPLLDKKISQNCVQTLNWCVHTPKHGDFGVVFTVLKHW